MHGRPSWKISSRNTFLFRMSLCLHLTRESPFSVSVSLCLCLCLSHIYTHTLTHCDSQWWCPPNIFTRKSCWVDGRIVLLGPSVLGTAVWLVLAHGTWEEMLCVTFKSEYLIVSVTVFRVVAFFLPWQPAMFIMVDILSAWVLEWGPMDWAQAHLWQTYNMHEQNPCYNSWWTVFYCI